MIRLLTHEILGVTITMTIQVKGVPQEDSGGAIHYLQLPVARHSLNCPIKNSIPYPVMRKLLCLRAKIGVNIKYNVCCIFF